MAMVRWQRRSWTPSVSAPNWDCAWPVMLGPRRRLATFPKLRPADITDFVRRESIGRIIVTMADRRGKLDVSELLKLKAGGVQIQDGPEYYETVTGKIPLESLRLSWLLFSPGFHVRPALRFYKRIFSVTFGAIGVILSSPVMVLSAIAIRLDSKGPIIFRQERVGEFGVPFTVYKFRTMYDHAPSPPMPPYEMRTRIRTTSGHRLSLTTRASPGSASGCGAPGLTNCRSSSTS